MGRSAVRRRFRVWGFAWLGICDDPREQCALATTRVTAVGVYPRFDMPRRFTVDSIQGAGLPLPGNQPAPEPGHATVPTIHGGG